MLAAGSALFSSFKMLRDAQRDALCVGHKREALPVALPRARTSFWNFEKLGLPDRASRVPAVRARTKRDTLAVAQTDDLQHFFSNTFVTIINLHIL